MGTKYRKYTYRDNASSLHRAVGDVIRGHPSLRSLRSFQEYPIPHTPFHVDWFILDLNLAIECHGEQHSRPVAFGGNKEEAEIAFKKQKIQDNRKKNLCHEQGWKTLEIWFNDDLSPDAIFKKIMEALKDGL